MLGSSSTYLVAVIKRQEAFNCIFVDTSSDYRKSDILLHSVVPQDEQDAGGGVAFFRSSIPGDLIRVIITI